MEILELVQQVELTNQIIDLSLKYKEAREKSANAQCDLNVILASKLASIREEKSNVGLEMALVMLMEKDTTAMELYAEYKKNEGTYKGLERVIKSMETKIIYIESVMKFERENT